LLDPTVGGTGPTPSHIVYGVRYVHLLNSKITARKVLSRALSPLCQFGKKFLRRMKAVALAKGRYRPGIDQECIKKWRENIAYSVARANARNVHVVTKRILTHA